MSYHDFTLYQLNHVSEGGVGDVIMALGDGTYKKTQLPSLSAIIGLQDEAISDILSNTKRGDLVLFEGREPFTYTNFLSVFKLTNNSATREAWSQFLEPHFNWYSKIADAIERKGRRTRSLESAAKPRLMRLSMRRDMTYYPNTIRRDYLLKAGRNISFRIKIDRAKPQLVVMAAGHAAFIAAVQKPKRMIWTDEKMKSEKLRLIYVAQHEQLVREIKRAKQVRFTRRPIGQRSWRKPPEK